MLSKRELKEKYEELFKTPSFALRADFDQKKFSEAYLKKARHNLELAGLLDLLSRDSEKKNAVQIAPTSQYFDWIIISSYYAMYLAATSALAKIGLKSADHDATIIALEHNYCNEKNLLGRKHIEMIENAKFGREDVQKMDDARKSRTSVQYTVSERYGDSEAKKSLKDAKEFVNKISEILN